MEVEARIEFLEKCLHRSEASVKVLTERFESFQAEVQDLFLQSFGLIENTRNSFEKQNELNKSLSDDIRKLEKSVELMETNNEDLQVKSLSLFLQVSKLFAGVNYELDDVKKKLGIKTPDEVCVEEKEQGS